MAFLARPPHASVAHVTDKLAGTPSALEIALEQICRDHAPRIHHLARHLLGNETDAEAVTQEVLLQVVRRLDTYRRQADVACWLQRIVVNVVAHRRGSGRSPCASPLGSAAQTRNRETRRLIEHAIATLPPAYRDVYVLADVEHLSNAQVGAALGLGLPAVRSRLHRARIMLREVLAPDLTERGQA
jgi:RNA polymerase sigma-70 factor (ECF subfamily)